MPLKVKWRLEAVPKAYELIKLFFRRDFCAFAWAPAWYIRGRRALRGVPAVSGAQPEGPGVGNFENESQIPVPIPEIPGIPGIPDSLPTPVKDSFHIRQVKYDGSSLPLLNQSKILELLNQETQPTNYVLKMISANATITESNGK